MMVTKRFILQSGFKKYFTSTWKTDNTSTGSSNSNQVKLPLESGGTYNFTVYWGDGSKNTITAYNQAEVTHTYQSVGSYTILIEGILKGFRFNNSGDKLKILNISKWADLELKSQGSFLGCNNLTFTATDLLYQNGTSAYELFRDCYNLNNTINLTFSNTCTNLGRLFFGCYRLNKSVSNINFENAVNLTGLFLGCSIFNQDITIIAPNCNDFSYMFQSCTAFNKSVSSINTAKSTTLANMFYDCTNFNQDISNFKVGLVTTMSNMLYNCSSFSRTNYDLFLISCYNQAIATGVQSNVTLTANLQNYTLGGTAETARNYLRTTKNWTINDAGGI